MASMEESRIVQRSATILTHGESLRLQYSYCPCPPDIRTKGTIVLLHGFPQTSYQFRHVIVSFSDAGYRVIAPDYRGAGGSSKPEHDFKKSTMAMDIHHLIHNHLGFKEKVHLVGHDIGGMVAHAYASRYPWKIASIAWGECPLPGTKRFEQEFGTIRQFHFIFQAIPDLADALVTGREEIYLKHFFDKLAFNTAAVSKGDLQEYVVAYSQPGALRCAFMTYAALQTDAEENRAWLAQNGKCSVPAMALSGDHSTLADEAEDMVAEMYHHVKSAQVMDSGHYLAEESPKDFINVVLTFIENL